MYNIKHMYNINPLLWGPHLWKFMHYLTLSYPDNPNEEDKQKFKNFFMMIGDYLPCEKCRVHYKSNKKTMPLTDEILNTRDGLIKWLFDFHNMVNQETGKPAITYDDFTDIYINNKQKNDSEENGKHKYVILFILCFVLLILFYIYKKCIKNV
jgi:hypothetical protein